MFNGLDHVAIVVPDTQEALGVWRDRFGLRVLFEETVNNGTVHLTHLDLGNTHLQLVQPLVDNHPLWDWLAQHGPGLHHICLAVDEVNRALDQTKATGMRPGELRPHQGTQGKRAVFLERASTGGVQVELTGA